MDLRNLNSSIPKVKYACSKEVIRVSKSNPKVLVKDYDFFIDLLNSPNNIMKWTSLDAIGGVISVTGDVKGVKLLISYLNKGKMITAGHAMNALTQVALARPEFRIKVINALLKVPNYKYDTSECNRIACSHVIACLELLGAKGKNVEDFLKKQVKSSRKSTSNRAKRLLSKVMSL